MLRSYRYSKIIHDGCKLFVKRNQSATNVVLKTTPSDLSILSDHIKGDTTTKLEFIRPEKYKPIPLYQVLDPEGKIKEENHKPDVSQI